jgi:hypothetical protein
MVSVRQLSSAAEHAVVPTVTHKHSTHSAAAPHYCAGQKLSKKQFSYEGSTLTIPGVPARQFRLRTVSTMQPPEKAAADEGFYNSGAGIFATHVSGWA